MFERIVRHGRSETKKVRLVRGLLYHYVLAAAIRTQARNVLCLLAHVHIVRVLSRNVCWRTRWRVRLVYMAEFRQCQGLC